MSSGKKSAAVHDLAPTSLANAMIHVAGVDDRPPVITLDVDTAKNLYELYANAEAADAHFHTCQSENFRQHIQSVYRAANVSKAYAKLKSAIDAAKGV